MNELIKKEFLELTEASDIKISKIEQFSSEKYISFPLENLTSLGSIFSSLSVAFSSISQSSNSGKVLYEAIFPVAGHLAKSKKDGNFLGTIINEKGIAGQARFKPVSTTAKTASSASMIFMALAVMAINQSLKNISENQKSILTFLETEKQTQLKGDLIILTDIIQDYQHNWNNNNFRSNREMQVLDIKRSAEHNILFYRKMIEDKLNKQSYINLDTTKTLNIIHSKFQYYKLALYLYAFSSFLDIMLLENFDETYLNSVISKINSYTNSYNEFYENSLKGIEKLAATSLQSKALKGLAIASKFAGKQIAKIPDKDNKLKIDDKLISGSDALEKINEKSIDKTVDSFSNVEDSGIKMFVDKIQLINRLHNKPTLLLFDSNNLYLPNENITV